MADEIDATSEEVVSLVDEAQNARQREKELTSDVASQISALQTVLYRYKGENTKSTPVSFIQNWRKLKKLEGPLLEALQEGVSASKLFELQGLSDDEQKTSLLAEIQEDDLTVADIRSKVRALKQQAPRAKQSPEPEPDLPRSYRDAVRKLTAKKNWQRITGDPKKMDRARALLAELEKLLEGN